MSQVTSVAAVHVSDLSSQVLVGVTSFKQSNILASNAAAGAFF